MHKDDIRIDTLKCSGIYEPEIEAKTHKKRFYIDTVNSSS